MCVIYYDSDISQFYAPYSGVLLLQQPSLIVNSKYLLAVV